MRSSSWQILLFLGLSLAATGCAGKLGKNSGPEPEVLRRGWNFVEEESELLSQETGSPDINFTSGIISGGRFYYGSTRFGLMAMNKETGRVYWRKNFPGGVASNLVIFDKRIYVGSQDGFFHALSVDTGEEIWKSNLNFPALGTPAIAQGRILVGSIDRAVHALDLTTGKELWAFRRGSTGTTTIKGGGNPAYIAGKFWVGFSDGTLVALDPNDGAASVEKQFQDNPKFSDIAATPVPWKRGILVSTYDGRIRYINPDGSLVWTFPAGGAHSPVATPLFGGAVFVAASDGHVYAIQDGTAKELWKFGLKRGIPTGIALVSQGEKHTLVVASSDNFVYALDAANGKLLAQDSLGSSSGSYADLVSESTKSDKLYLVSHYGRVFQYNIKRR